MNEFTNWINVHWSNKLFIFSRISSALRFNGHDYCPSTNKIFRYALAFDRVGRIFCAFLFRLLNCNQHNGQLRGLYSVHVIGYVISLINQIHVFWFTLPCIVQFHLAITIPVHWIYSTMSVSLCKRARLLSLLLFSPFNIVDRRKQMEWRYKQFLRKWNICIHYILCNVWYYTNPDNFDNWIVIVPLMASSSLIGSYILYCIFDMVFRSELQVFWYAS